ncbi:dTDP-4-dehydrorhamnose reductase [Youngiibacter fragilis]|uniref:dTDP-4-dehydrorhamnose reductase n=1 Tax=Youngiibacter fragilis 232.1 TaxID=994573 RepID=V7I6S7_9CLOT|nr:dTDP-4-dehydrorhamnose reductase [Youngiibacter fragilis]ETA80692.1 dTDP-4-dehydrorhamnose reductase [Youngiibacter fragilis 232.1]
MRILITGAKGQLGTQLSEILKIGKTELGDIPECFIGAEVYGYSSKELDVSDLSAVRAAAARIKPDIIINSAAYTNVDGCETDRDRAFRVNALGPRNLAMVAEEIGARLIHISTDYVFSGTGNVPFAEYDLTDPQSIYGKSKLAGEENVKTFCSRHFIVRTSWLYGLYGGNFVKTIMKAGKERGALQVVDDQTGNPTNVEDLCHHILKLAETEEYGVYHCTGAGECSWYDFASLIIEYAGIEATVAPVSTDQFPRPARRPAYSSLDNMMLRVTVGDNMRPWQDALKSFMISFEKMQQ